MSLATLIPAIVELLARLPLLALCWLIPLLGAGLEAWLARSGRAGRAILPTTALSLAAAAGAFEVFTARDQPTLSERWPLPAAIDGIGALFLPLAALMALLVALFGRRVYRAQRPGWEAPALLLFGCMQGMAVSADLLQVAAFFALEILPCHLLIRDHGVTADRQHAARRVSIFLALSAALFLAGTILLGVEHQQATGSWSTAHADLVGLPIRRSGLIFLLLFLAVAIRTPVFPFHGWMIAALEHGPAVGLNVFLLGVKTGILCLLRDILPILPDEAARWAPYVSLAGIAGLLYGALLALVQLKLRRILAFITLSHMGYIVPALFTLNRYGVEGALVEAMNLGIAAAGLYFAAGSLSLRAGSTDLDRLQKITPAMPRLSIAFLIILLTSLGMPGTLGFQALHLVLEGALLARSWSAALLVGLGTVISAGCLLWNYQRLFLHAPASPNPASSSILDLDRTELFILAVLCALIVTGQSAHHPVLTLVPPAVDSLMERIGPGF